MINSSTNNLNVTPTMLSNSTQKFISLQALAGLLLVGVLIVALIIANSPLNHWYEGLVQTPIQIGAGNFIIKKPFLLWVNEGLMAIFFMLLALEIKREILEGELSQRSQLLLPIAGALGGIIFPALIYALFNYHDAAKLRGWPIATTTDIAFVVGIISLLGNRVPNSLKALLIALSIVDDILAVIIIAAYYTDSLSWYAMLAACAGIIILVIFNFFEVVAITPFLLIGIMIWTFVLQSGVHATLAGIAIGLTVPLKNKKDPSYSPAKVLEKSLHPWVAFFILPLFVFMNGGINFTNFSIGQLFTSVPLAIIAGLLVGKSFGAFFFSAVTVKLRWSQLPVNTNFWQLLALCFLSGIGFTMSLFLVALAFNGSEHELLASQGVLVGSLLAGLVGVTIFCITARKSMQSS